MGFTFAQNDQILVMCEYPMLLVTIWSAALCAIVLRVGHLKFFPPILLAAWALSKYVAEVCLRDRDRQRVTRETSSVGWNVSLSLSLSVSVGMSVLARVGDRKSEPQRVFGKDRDDDGASTRVGMCGGKCAKVWGWRQVGCTTR